MMVVTTAVVFVNNNQSNTLSLTGFAASKLKQKKWKGKKKIKIKRNAKFDCR